MVYSNDAKQRDTIHAAQLCTEFTVRSAAKTEINNSSAAASGSSTSSTSQMFKSAIVTTTATLGTETLTLSNHILTEINKLPPWDGSSKEVKTQYHMFFMRHGTHFNVQATLGRVLGVMSCNNFNEEQEMVLRMINANVDSPVTALIGVNARAAASRKRTKERHSTSGSGSISISREGGKVVASDLTSKLEDLFNHFHKYTPNSPWLQSWLEIQARWVSALETDPVFCADDPGTCYHWLYDLDKITLTQKMDLQLASDWYLWGPVEDNKPKSVADPSDCPLGIPLPCDKNLNQVEATLVNTLTKWFQGVWKWIWSWI